MVELQNLIKIYLKIINNNINWEKATGVGDEKEIYKRKRK